MPGKAIDTLLYYLQILLFMSMAFLWRAVTSISLACIVAACLVASPKQPDSRLKPLLFATAAFFILQIPGVFISAQWQESWKHILLKSSVPAIPLCFYVYRHKSPVMSFIWLLAAGLLYCLAIAGWKYGSSQAGIDLFFYHQLVSPLQHHAVYYAIMVFAGLIYLVEFVPGRLYRPLIVFFVIAILLLASKLVIVFTGIYLLTRLFSSLQKIKMPRYAAIAITLACIMLSGLVLAFTSPVNHRFKDIIRGNWSLVTQPVFSPANYFDGIQFRVLQWRFTAEILSAEKAWLTGVSPARAQQLLNQKYIGTHMYTGRPGTSDHGYLGYNTHNQFLESTLQTGLPGLLSFAGICAGLVLMALSQNKRALWFLVALLLTYSFTEAVLETQYGILLFLFIPLLFYSPAKTA